MNRIRRLAKYLLGFVLLVALATTITIQLSGDGDFTYSLDSHIVNDVTGLNPVRVARVVAPDSVDAVIAAVRDSEGPISIGGGRYSQGGQIAYPDSLHLDMRGFNAIIDLDPQAREITVQPGITWREIQAAIDPHDLSVRIMQTYANFTVGGSLSVNVHGRYIGEGPLVHSVKSIKLVLADGSLIAASPDENSELFYGAIGGYGGLGVIVEARLSLAENSRIERITTPMSITEYPQHFFSKVRNNPDVIFHNADIYPPAYEQVRDVSWYRTDKPVTIDQRLIAEDTDYWWQPRAARFVAASDFGKSVREHIIDPLYYAFDRVVWRNWEASYDVRELEPPSRTETTYVLREYFVPVANFQSFVERMREIFQRHQANIVNVSIRHAHADPGTLLAWAREESFAFVVYYRQGTDTQARERVRAWSLEMIDAAIAEGGSYYLPYQVFASPAQFHAAYPGAEAFFALKRRVDPDYRFRNRLWSQHYPVEDAAPASAALPDIDNYRRGEEQTFLTIPEWYLVFNPLEYADFLEAGNNPSDFPFLASIDEYWTLYDRARAICRDVYPENPEYLTMLRVIGISTTVEYLFKALYENSIGRLTRWSAGGQDTAEDRLIQQAQRAYSDLIFHTAWYEFDFGSWVARIWREPDFFGEHFARKLERKLSFTFEYGFKSLYAKLIELGARTAYEQSDGLIYLTARVPEAVVEDTPDSVRVVQPHPRGQVLSVVRWGPFTEAIPGLAERGVQFLDISGNRRIALSVLVPQQEADVGLAHVRELFRSRVLSRDDITRVLLLSPVEHLHDTLGEIKARGYTLEHIYDY